MEEKTKLIKPAWNETLKFLAGMLDEQNVTALFEELSREISGTNNPASDSTHRKNLEEVIEIAADSNNLMVKEGNILDALTTRYMNIVGTYDCTWCGGYKYWKNSTLGQVLTLVLNGEVSIGKKVKVLDKASFYYKGTEHFDQLDFKPQSLLPEVAPAIVEYIHSCEKANPALVCELSQRLVNTAQTKDIFSKELAEAPPEKKSYFLQLLGDVVKPDDLIKFIQTHSALGFREKRYLYQQFGTIGKSSVDILLKNFGSNPEDDFMIVDALGELGDTNAVESLCQRLESEYSSGIALHGLLNTLGRIGGPMATTYLIRFLDSDKPRNFEAVETLIQVGNHSALGALRKFRERYSQKYAELKTISKLAEQREKQKPDFGATIKLNHYEPQELYAMSFVYAYEKIPKE
jgi:hypothetical protein